ncbi:MAG TPA: Gldg family protein [Waterburya sp.]
MKTLKSKTYLTYLFWLGPIFTIMGLTAWVVGGEWSPVALGLLIAGIALIGLWLIFLGSLVPGFWGRRSTQAGTNAIIATLAMVVILGLINFLGVRYAQRIDLTENQLFTLSPLSQMVVKKLQQPVKVWIFSPQPNPADLELLKNYQRYGAKFQYEFVNPQLQPGLAQKFDVKSAGAVYLASGTQRKFLQTVSDAERLSEVKLTNGLEQLSSDRIDKVYFLQGHGERPLEEVEGGLSQAVSALKDKNFTALPLNLAERTEIPQDASLIVVASPERPLFEGEVQALRNYLAMGGSLLVMLDPDSKSGLDSLLAEWGVKLDPGIIIDASGQGRVVGLSPATSLVSNYGNHPITKNFGNNYSLYPVARPVEVTSIKGVTETPLLRTNDQSWEETTPEKQPLQYDPNADRPGPLTLGVALTRKAQPIAASPTPKSEVTATPGALSPSPSASPSPSPAAKGQKDKGQPTASPTPQAQATGSPGATPSPSASSSPSPAAKGQKDKGQPTASPTPQAQATASPGTSPSSSPSPSPAAKGQKEKGQPTASPTPQAQATATPGASPSSSPSPSPVAKGQKEKGQPTASPTPQAQATATPGASPSPSASTSPALANQVKTNPKNPESRLVVIGNSSFTTNGWLEQQLNRDVFLNTVSWLSNRDEQTLSIGPREQKSRRLNLTGLQASLVGWTALFIMPLLGLTTAGIMWWRRR